MSSVELLGVRIHRLTMPQAVAAVMQMVIGGGHHQVITLNASMLYRAARDERFRALVNSAALVTPDGMGVMLVARILGLSFPEKVSGVDLTGRLCEACAADPFRVFLLGAAPGVAALAGERLRATYPGLQIVGTHHGYFDTAEEPTVIAAVRSAGTHLLFVALGSPKQEEWIATHLQDVGASVAVGIGGSLDVYAGRAKLAPEWVRRAGLEWVYRIAREPRRWRVLLTLLLVVLLAFKERIANSVRSVFRSTGN